MLKFVSEISRRFVNRENGELIVESPDALEYS